MILVTVGTHGHGFERLVVAMDELAAKLDEQVVMQRGSSAYVPSHAEHFRFASSERMATLGAEARVIVAHAAAGTILTTLKQGKPLVLVPRLRRFGEAKDNHQLQLAGALDALRKAVVVHEPSAVTLDEAIRLASGRTAQSEGPARLACALRDQLERWEKAESFPELPIRR